MSVRPSSPLASCSSPYPPPRAASRRRRSSASQTSAGRTSPTPSTVATSLPPPERQRSPAEASHARARACAFVPRRPRGEKATSHLERDLAQHRSLLHRDLPASCRAHLEHSVASLQRLLDARKVDALAASMGRTSLCPDPRPRAARLPAQHPRCLPNAHRPVTIKPLPEADLARVQPQVSRAEQDECHPPSDAPLAAEDEPKDWLFDDVLPRYEAG